MECEFPEAVPRKTHIPYWITQSYLPPSRGRRQWKAKLMLTAIQGPRSHGVQGVSWPPLFQVRGPHIDVDPHFLWGSLGAWMLLTTRLSCQTSGYVIENATAGTYSPLLYNSRQQIGLKPAPVISLPVTCNTESFTYFIKTLLLVLGNHWVGNDKVHGLMWGPNLQSMTSMWWYGFNSDLCFIHLIP